jgi:predicted nucleic acid-binding protein
MALHALAALAQGETIVLDANTFIYAITGRSSQCRELLERAQNGELVAVTPIEVVNEVCHKLMLIEALERGVIDRISASALRSRASEIKNLSSYWASIEEIFALNIRVLPLDQARVRRAHRVRTAHGLLTNDSLVAAAAQQEGIQNLATSDRDFEPIGWLTIYRPVDLP